MSGAEVLGLISAVVGIIETIGNIYTGLKDAENLPQVFREVAGRLPLVQITLQAIEEQIRANTDEEACQAMKTVVESCRIKAKHLEEIFEAVVPSEGASRFARYCAIVRRLGKENRVEVLTKDIMEDVSALAANGAVQAATKAQVANLQAAIEELDGMEPSVQDENPSVNQQHYGTGDIVAGNKHEGTHNEYKGSGQAHFGSVYNKHYVNIMKNQVMTEVRLVPRQECLKSLSFPGLDDRANNIGGAAVGTCGWLFQHSTYKAWVRRPKCLLEIKGKPGSGKSTLMRYVVKNVKGRPTTEKGALILSFFFHSRGSELQKSSLGLLRSLIFQLLTWDKVPDALADFVAISHQRCEILGKPGKDWQWHQHELQQFFESALLKILETHSVWLFVDALEECGQDKELASNFKSLLQRSQLTGLKQLHICFTRRHYPNLELNGKSTITMDTHTTQDIATFVNAHFSDTSPHADVADLIINHSQGVFMWACLALERVRDMIDDGESTVKIKRKLRKVPEDFSLLYRNIIESSKNRSATMKLMQWMCFSMRPLTTEEIRWAMVLNSNYTYGSLDSYKHSEDFITTDKVERRIKALSCGLAETVPLSNVSNIRTLQFIHPSVKDVLVERELMALYNPNTQAHLVVPAAHCLLSRCCIRYLHMAISSQPAPLTEDDKSRFPFLHYATTSWTFHAQLGDTAETSPSELLRLLQQRPEFIESWVEIFQWMEPFSHDCPSTGSQILHVASRYGMTKLLHNLLRNRNGVGVDTTDQHGQTPLSWAARNGHKEAVELLVNTQKVNIDSRDENGLTPLSWAARNGKRKVVKLLLKTKNVSIDARDKNGATPLAWASRNGEKEVVKQLLRTKKVDVNARDNFDWTPLSRATWNGHQSVVKLLLDTEKVDVHVKDTVHGQTPLSWAVSNGHEAVASLLLGTNKVDINARDKNGQTSLLRATKEGQNAVVKLLLNTEKADINAKDNTGQTALSQAAENGHEAVVGMLVEKGATLEVENNNSDTPLLLAAYRGNEDVVRLLLRQGANLEVENKYGDTPLMWAAYNGDEAVARMLLEKGANVEAKNEYGDTPLLVAIYHRHEAIVRLLLAKGANIEVRSKIGQTPLLQAIWDKQEAVARLLLEEGAEVEVQNEDGNTPLLCAVFAEKEALVKLLLEQGVNVETTNMVGDTPLSSAESGGQEAIARLLRDKGARK